MSELSDFRIRFLGDVVPFANCRVELPGDVPVVLNLECPITRTKVPAQAKVVLKTETDWLTPAFGKRLCVACLANNHIMDYGAQGLADTVAVLEAAGVVWFGAGMCREQVRNAVVANIHNHRIGFSGYVCPSTHPIFATADTPGVLPLDLNLISEDLRCLRAQGAERVVVCLHWGAEEIPYPRPDDITLARTIAEMGADLIIGHHSHCIQPYEVHAGCPILYGIGNAIMPHLDLPCNYDSLQQPAGKYVKKQRIWNRTSLAVEYSTSTRQVHLQKIIYDGDCLRLRRSCVAGVRLLGGRTSAQAVFFRLAAFYGTLRCLVAGFAEHPRLPRLHHLRSLCKFPPYNT